MMRLMSQPGPDELDREQAFLNGLAGVTVAYFEALQANGLSPAAALVLVRDWHAMYLRDVRDAARDARS